MQIRKVLQSVAVAMASIAILVNVTACNKKVENTENPVVETTAASTSTTAATTATAAADTQPVRSEDIDLHSLYKITSELLTSGDGNFTYYELEGNEVVIKEYIGKTKVIQLPEGIDSRKIKYLAPAAFAHNRHAKEITLPDTITEIGKDCFANCAYLQKLNLGNGIKKLPTSSIILNEELTSLVLPKDLEELESSAVTILPKLVAVEIPASVKKIGNSNFDGCSPNLVIKGTAGSAAEIFCTNNGMKFEPLVETKG